MKNSNTTNLCAFWELAGTKAGTMQLKNGVGTASIPNSDWPNRLWITTSIHHDQLSLAREIMSTQEKTHKLAVFQAEDENTAIQLAPLGFEFVSAQTGMNLSLSHWKIKRQSDRVQLIRVQSYQQAKKWSQLFAESFGYVISVDTVRLLLTDASFYIIHDQGEPAGTVILFYTDAVVGIHGLGILPEMRGQGIAKITMEIVLNQVKLRGKELACLQASDSAFRMYKRLGFREQFKMFNYQINTL